MIGTLLGRLQRVRPVRGQYLAQCPTHNDRKQSLAVRQVGERVLVHCHANAGCTTAGILEALGLEWDALFAAEGRRRHMDGDIKVAYGYYDEAGTLLYQVCRLEPKGFFQRRPDDKGGWLTNMDGVRRVPYKLPQIRAEMAAKKAVWIVEGEKDANLLWRFQLPATTNAGGAGKWEMAFAEHFQGAHCLLIPDNDEAGRRHMRGVALSLLPVAASVRVLDLSRVWPGMPEKADVSDYLHHWMEAQRALGHDPQSAGSREQLKAIARETRALRVPSQDARLRAAIERAAARVIEGCADPFMADGDLMLLCKDQFRRVLVPAASGGAG